MSWELIERNSNGWKHYIDQYGNDRYQKPNGKFAGEKAWSGSFSTGDVERIPAEPPEPEPPEPDVERIPAEPPEPEPPEPPEPEPPGSGTVGPVPENRLLTEQTDRTPEDTAVIRTYEVYGPFDAESLLNRLDYQGYQYQLELDYKCKKGGEGGTAVGHSKFSLNHDTMATMTQMGETREMRDVEMRAEQAYNFAYANIPCSPQELYTTMQNIRVFFANE